MITVNGKTKDWNAEISLEELLLELSLSKTLCAVEVNDELVPHRERDKYTLQDGDKIEIVSLVGGG